MALFPTGRTPFLLEIGSAQGSFMKEIPRTPDDAADEEAGRYLLIRLIRADTRPPDANSEVRRQRKASA
jgi:hypothetical protein